MASAKLKRYFEFSSLEKNRMNGLCKLCHRNYKDLSGTYSNFLKHLKRKHLSEYQDSFVRSDDDLSEDIDIPKDQSTSNDPPHMDSKQGRIGLSIAKNLIIKCNLPFSIVENPAFREFVKGCYPKWQPISAKKLKSDIVTSFKSRVDKVIGEALEKINSLTLTIDCWSDRRSRGFLGITGHFIDEQMLPQAYLIDFVRLKSPHTGENIQRATEYVLDRFNIKEKVYRIVTDNAASMIKAYQFGLVVDTDHRIEDTSCDNLIPVDLPTSDDDDRRLLLSLFVHAR
jgi:BED zinc finger